MSAHGEKLTRKYEELIAALLTESTIGAAAARTGISEATALRWLKQPEVAEAYREARRQVVEHALTTVQAATSEAVEALRRNVGPEAPPAVQVRAACAILEMAVRGVEVDDLAARIETLEQRVEEQGPGRPQMMRGSGGA